MVLWIHGTERAYGATRLSAATPGHSMAKGGTETGYGATRVRVRKTQLLAQVSAISYAISYAVSVTNVAYGTMRYTCLLYTSDAADDM
eukprot:2350893-Rhodomonas_salina.1